MDALRALGPRGHRQVDDALRLVPAPADCSPRAQRDCRDLAQWATDALLRSSRALRKRQGAASGPADDPAKAPMLADPRYWELLAAALGHDALASAAALLPLSLLNPVTDALPLVDAPRVLAPCLALLCGKFGAVFRPNLDSLCTLVCALVPTDSPLLPVALDLLLAAVQRAFNSKKTFEFVVPRIVLPLLAIADRPRVRRVLAAALFAPDVVPEYPQALSIDREKGVIFSYPRLLFETVDCPDADPRGLAVLLDLFVEARRSAAVPATAPAAAPAADAAEPPTKKRKQRTSATTIEFTFFRQLLAIVQRQATGPSRPAALAALLERLDAQGVYRLSEDVDGVQTRFLRELLQEHVLPAGADVLAQLGPVHRLVLLNQDLLQADLGRVLGAVVAAPRTPEIESFAADLVRIWARLRAIDRLLDALIVAVGDHSAPGESVLFARSFREALTGAVRDLPPGMVEACWRALADQLEAGSLSQLAPAVVYLVTTVLEAVALDPIVAKQLVGELEQFCGRVFRKKVSGWRSLLVYEAVWALHQRCMAEAGVAAHESGFDPHPLLPSAITPTLVSHLQAEGKSKPERTYAAARVACRWVRTTHNASRRVPLPADATETLGVLCTSLALLLNLDGIPASWDGLGIPADSNTLDGALWALFSDNVDTVCTYCGDKEAVGRVFGHILDPATFLGSLCPVRVLAQDWFFELPRTRDLCLATLVSKLTGALADPASDTPFAAPLDRLVDAPAAALRDIVDALEGGSAAKGKGKGKSKSSKSKSRRKSKGGAAGLERTAKLLAGIPITAYSESAAQGVCGVCCAAIALNLDGPVHRALLARVVDGFAAALAGAGVHVALLPTLVGADDGDADATRVALIGSLARCGLGQDPHFDMTPLVHAAGSHAVFMQLAEVLLERPEVVRGSAALTKSCEARVQRAMALLEVRDSGNAAEAALAEFGAAVRLLPDSTPLAHMFETGLEIAGRLQGRAEAFLGAYCALHPAMPTDVLARILALLLHTVQTATFELLVRESSLEQSRSVLLLLLECVRREARGRLAVATRFVRVALEHASGARLRVVHAHLDTVLATMRSVLSRPDATAAVLEDALEVVVWVMRHDRGLRVPFMEMAAMLGALATLLQERDAVVDAAVFQAVVRVLATCVRHRQRETAMEIHLVMRVVTDLIAVAFQSQPQQMQTVARLLKDLAKEHKTVVRPHVRFLVASVVERECKTPLDAEFREDLTAGVFELMDVCEGGHEFRQMQRALDDDGRELFRALFREYEETRYTGKV